MYGWSGFGIARFSNPTESASISGRYAVPGIVRTGGAADERLTDDAVTDADFDPVMFSRAHHSDYASTRADAPADDLTLLGQKVNKQGQTIINSSGGSHDPFAIDPPAAHAGFFSSIPWWAWLAGAGVGVYALKGAKR